jgi:hypothetical protein
MLPQGVNGCNQVASRVGLQQVSVGAGLEHSSSELFGIVHGQDQNFCVRERSPNLPGGLQAVEFGHTEVKDCHVRFQQFRLGNGFAAGSSFADNLPSSLGFQQVFQTASDEFVIISQQDMAHAHAFTMGGYHLLQTSPCNSSCTSSLWTARRV